MKRGFILMSVGFFIFLACFLVSVSLHDYFLKVQLRDNVKKIKLGMSEQEVIQILGMPNHRWSEDSPASSWCYDTDTISHSLEEQPDIECGNMVLKMSSHKDGKVVKIFDF
jgi:hypothetical protein